MKKCVWIGLLLFTISIKAAGQSEEAQQLLLNVEKLSQLRVMLSDLKKGYTVLHKGYSSIKEISEGSFDLHKVFLDRLLEVSPAVRQYSKTTEIVSLQLALVRDYKKAYRDFIMCDLFSPRELEYLARVYSHLIAESLKNLESFSLVLTAGTLRMNDEERLTEIDRIWQDLKEKTHFLRKFNAEARVLALQRHREGKEVRVIKGLYGFQP